MSLTLNPRTGNQTRYQIDRLNHRHEQIINWLIANPDKKLGECAAFFKYTPAWVSQVVHSDVFQARYQQRCEEVGMVATHTLGAKMNNLAAVTIDKITERITSGVASERLMCDTLNSTLKSLGYGAEPPAADPTKHEHVHLHVQAEDIRAAREKAALAHTGMTELKVTNHGDDQQPTALPAPAAA